MSVPVGATLLTRMPCGASSQAACQRQQLIVTGMCVSVCAPMQVPQRCAPILPFCETGNQRVLLEVLQPLVDWHWDFSRQGSSTAQQDEEALQTCCVRPITANLLAVYAAGAMPARTPATLARLTMAPRTPAPFIALRSPQFDAQIPFIS